MNNKVQFSALNPYEAPNMPNATERLSRDSQMIQWGDDNLYPKYLSELYTDCGILNSVVNGVVDYICGDNITGIDHEIFRKLALDYTLYNGFALQVVRNVVGEITNYYYVDFANCRTNEDRSVIYYSKEFDKRRGKMLSYPAFKKDSTETSSILYVTAPTKNVYPTPMYGAQTTLQACEIQKNIVSYHFNSLSNGFLGGVMFNFSNGIPDDELKEEIEDNILEKFSGTGNANRILINFSDDSEHGLQITPLNVEDFGEKYNTLLSKSEREIFTAFRATPSLFGIPTENVGFNTQEYDSVFQLFNRTVVKPIQKTMITALSEVGLEVVVKPFTLNLDD